MSETYDVVTVGSGHNGLVAAAYLALAIWKLPPWLVVLLGAAGGWGLGDLLGLIG